MDTQSLTYGVEERRIAVLRLPTGEDELSIAGIGYADATAFVSRLLVDGAGRIGSSDLPSLAICDLDQLVRALFAELVGPAAEIHCRCSACGEPFEFALPLAALAQPPEKGDAEPGGGLRFRLPGGIVLRLPTVADLVAPAPADAIGADRFVCTAGTDAPEAVEAALARLCPTASDLVDTECPSCGAAVQVDFDLAIFLMKSLRRERDLLLREVHVIARAYGWSLAEILSLPRDIRHGFVRLAGGKPAAVRRHAA